MIEEDPDVRVGPERSRRRHRQDITNEYVPDHNFRRVPEGEDSKFGEPYILLIRISELGPCLTRRR